MTNISNEKRHINTYPTKIQKGICYEQLRVNKFDNLYEMDKFLVKKEVEKGSLSI